ncbi:N-acetylglucosamine-6-phosphate deacetylase [Planococcus sp. FY231025]|uniref:N-acetylglucosamine-6-phosphate deacetylase n=1 Tax=Planococcus sp. FY231025 TaxID=3455699 RepID=UPI003F8E9993
MEKSLLITGITIADSETDSFTGDILIEEGKITQVAASISADADLRIDAAGKDWKAVPGFIDVHIHGAAGFDAMDATPEALGGLASALPREGTTGFLATTMTQSDAAISAALENAARFTANGAQAEMLGIHLEGPFISAKQPGAQPLEHIVAPSFPQFERWQRQSGGRIRMVTIAPETENGLAFTEQAAAEGVVVSIGHSDASFAEAKAAMAAGAGHVTHLYNQMSSFHHREPGVVGAALLEDGLMVEIIADFIHSHPKAVEMAYHQIGAERLVLITDSMRAKGLAPGTYDLGGQNVEVGADGARLSNGRLAGSILTMEDAVKNMRSATGCTLSELVAMTSANAAKELGLANKGKIEAGRDADIAILDSGLNVQMTICWGNIAYAKERVQ